MVFNGRNVSISPLAHIGQGVRIGHNTVIHPGVVIADHAVICNDCTIGEPLAAYYEDETYAQPATHIGPHALIRSHAIIYAGSSFGAHLHTGHHAVIREHCTVGDHCSIGTFCDLQGHIAMGHHCRLHSSVHLAKGSTLGSFVFIYPFAVLTNDRFPPSLLTEAPSIDDYTQIGAHATIMAGINVGRHCLIGAGAVVNRHVDDHSFMVGAPAIRKSDVRDLKDADGSALYPWPQRFDRGMPWEGQK